MATRETSGMRWDQRKQYTPPPIFRDLDLDLARPSRLPAPRHPARRERDIVSLLLVPPESIIAAQKLAAYVATDLGAAMLFGVQMALHVFLARL